MEIFLIKLLQFILAISLLILLHEGGHFFFSKLFGVRVEKFYLFFDPWFHLFQFKPRNSDTTYGIGWLPLGGYCKISGMIDESMDTEQMNYDRWCVGKLPPCVVHLFHDNVFLGRNLCCHQGYEARYAV